MFSKPFLSVESHRESGVVLCSPGVNLLRTVTYCHCDYSQKLQVNKSGFFSHLGKELDINLDSDREKTSQGSTEKIVVCCYVF